MLHCHCCSRKEQLVAPCKKKKCWPLKQTGIFKIMQGKTTHWNQSCGSSRSTEQSYTSILVNLSNCWSSNFHCLQLLFCAVTQIFCNNHAKIVAFLYAPSYFKRIFNIRNKDRRKKMLDLGNLNFRIRITKVWQTCL